MVAEARGTSGCEESAWGVEDRCKGRNDAENVFGALSPLLLPLGSGVGKFARRGLSWTEQMTRTRFVMTMISLFVASLS